jgi:hypothetical protein
MATHCNTTKEEGDGSKLVSPFSLEHHHRKRRWHTTIVFFFFFSNIKQATVAFFVAITPHKKIGGR